MRTMLKALFSAALVIGSLAATLPVQAESYLGLQLGFSKPMDFGDFTPQGPIKSITPKDIDMSHSLTYGIRAGHYFDTMPWLGVELDAYNANPSLGKVRATVSTGTSGEGGGSGTKSIELPGASMRVFTLAPLLMIRYPGDTVQPYAGVGPAFAFAKISGNGQGHSDNGAIGLVAKAGLLYKITPQIGVFGEWKFTSVDLDLVHPYLSGTTMTKANYTANAVIAGISYHFGQ